LLSNSPRPQFLAFAVTAALGAASCSGGSSNAGIESPAVEGLEIADQMSVVTVDEGSAFPTAQLGDGFPPDSDYATDASRAYVYDPSMRSLQTVNMILCLLKQTAFSGLVNEGLYNAQIDEASCQSGGDSGGETGQSSGEMQQLSVWVVQSVRANNDSVQTLDFWIPDTDDGDGVQSFRAQMTITEGVSAENPFGVFDLNWMDIDAQTDEVLNFGNLHTLDVADGFIGFSFYEEEGDVTAVPNVNAYAARTQANVNMFADQSQGVAHILRQERNDNGFGDSGILENRYRIAFDETNVLRGEDMDAPDCLSRTDFLQSTWRYNLYDSTTGERVELNSGFGFETEGGHYGWVGYHGLWAPNGVSVEHGDTVTRQTYGEEIAETYTVFQAPGKLVKKTRNSLSTESLGGVVFEWFDYGPPGFPNQMPERAHVEYQAPLWVVTELQDQQSGEWIEVDPPTVIATEDYGFLGMWCPELGGSVSFVHGAESITYFAESVVTPEDALFLEGDVTLYGYFECLDGAITSNEANSGDVFQTNSTSVSEPHAYRFDAATMTLRLLVGDDVGAPAGLADGAEVTQGPFTWGMRSGPLVVSTLDFTSMFDIWSADVFYTYETGQNSWNKYTTLLDEDLVAVEFEAPIEFSYTHSTENDANGDSAFAGRTYLFSYGGLGNLHGIPSMQVDLDGNGQPDRFLPTFSLAAGTIVGDEGQYVVKPMESEYTLQDATGQCGALNIDTVGDLPLPDASDWTLPDIGPKPEVTSAPRVIEGVIVGSGS